MKKIDLIIVGAQKAGTTSLKNYLRSHPDITGHPSSEFSFFSDDSEYAGSFETTFHKYFDKKPFSKIIAKNVTISQKEDYLVRVKKHNPEIKIVFFMREPVSRAYSAYNMAVRDGWMQRSFDELLKIIEEERYDDIMYRHFIEQGQYANPLKRILKYFPAQNIKIFLFEDLKENPQTICEHIFKWLGLDNHLISEKIYNPTLQPKSKRVAKLINKFRNQNNYLKRLAKSILPYFVFQKLSQYIIHLNTSNRRFTPMIDEKRMKLLAHFEVSNRKLISLLNGELRDSLCIIHDENWISNIGTRLSHANVL